MMKPYEIEAEQDRLRDRIVYGYLKAGGRIYRNDYSVFGKRNLKEFDKYLSRCAFAKRCLDTDFKVFYIFREE
jgi:hypothetical protein